MITDWAKVIVFCPLSKAQTVSLHLCSPPTIGNSSFSNILKVLLSVARILVDEMSSSMPHAQNNTKQQLKGRITSYQCLP